MDRLRGEKLGDGLTDTRTTTCKIVTVSACYRAQETTQSSEMIYMGKNLKERIYAYADFTLLYCRN